MPSASVIVPARDARATLPRALRALTAQRFAGDYEVIVVDDGSRDGTADLARRGAREGSNLANLANLPNLPNLPNVTLIEQPARGPATARNAGVARARGEVLAFCDADVFVAEGWLQAGVDALRTADLVQGRVLPDPEAQLGPFDRTLWVTSQVGLWETANLFVTRPMFDAAGGFQEWLRPRRGKALAEDVWFGYRALRAGARPAFCPGALAHHAVFRRSWSAYAAERARLRFFPAMAARMPELRTAFLYRQLFLNCRSARFDLACAAGLAALARRSPLPLLAAAPYARTVHAHAQRVPPGPAAPAIPAGSAIPAGPAGSLRVAGVAAADVLADAVGCAALIAGSARYRSLVL